MTKAEEAKDKRDRARKYLADLQRVRYQGRRHARVQADPRIKRARPTFYEDVVVPWREAQRAKWDAPTKAILDEIAEALAPRPSPKERIRRATMAPPPEQKPKREDTGSEDHGAIDTRNLLRAILGEQRELNLTNQLRAMSADSLATTVADARKSSNEPVMKFATLEHERRIRMKEYAPPAPGKINEQAAVSAAITAAERDWPLPADEQEAIPYLEELADTEKDLREMFAEVWDGKERTDRDGIKNSRLGLSPREAEDKRRVFATALTRDVEQDVRNLLKAQIDEGSPVT